MPTLKDPEFKVMLAQKYNPKRIEDWSAIHAEPKLDGIRVIVTVSRDKVPRYYSRNGRQLFMFDHISEDILKLRHFLSRNIQDYLSGIMLDGEMTMKSESFNEISGAIHRKDYTEESAEFHCFHIMPLPDFRAGADTETQGTRKGQLFIADKTVKTKNFFVEQPAHVLCDSDVRKEYEKAMKNKLEGLIIKDYSKPWIGRRDYAWMKMKEELSVDIVVVDILPGKKGKYENTCGRLLALYKGKEVRVSGMTDDQRRKWWKNPKLIVDRTIEVSYQLETEAGALRHPRFKRIRGDKE